MEGLEMSLWKNHNVFVTGATGLLGSWLVEELLSQGAQVTCLVRDWVPGCKFINEGLINSVNIVRGELEDYMVLLRSINENEIDTVFHLGAQTIVGTSSRSALSTFEANIRGTWNLLEACKNCSRLIQRIIVASSDKAYGSHEHLPYTEATPLQGQFPYDVSKSCADLISISYFHSYHLPIAITRCGNLFGGGDLNFNRLVPGTIRSAMNNEAPIVRSDGTYIRDYFYVRDAVKAYLNLAEQLPDERFIGQAFNFGNEQPLSVIEMVQIILRLMNKAQLKAIILNESTNEIQKQYLDCTKARQMLNWRPAFTLEDALLETIAWYQDYFTAKPKQ